MYVTLTNLGGDEKLRNDASGFVHFYTIRVHNVYRLWCSVHLLGQVSVLYCTVNVWWWINESGWISEWISRQSFVISPGWRVWTSRPFYDPLGDPWGRSSPPPPHCWVVCFPAPPDNHTTQPSLSCSLLQYWANFALKKGWWSLDNLLGYIQYILGYTHTHTPGGMQRWSAGLDKTPCPDRWCW